MRSRETNDTCRVMPTSSRVRSGFSFRWCLRFQQKSRHGNSQALGRQVCGVGSGARLRARSTKDTLCEEKSPHLRLVTDHRRYENQETGAEGLQENSWRSTFAGERRAAD